MIKSRNAASYFAITALSLSIGWGIRGNFGHEQGAMIAGALAAIAVAILSGRADWQRRAPFFGLFGAVGWCFGGTMSYGMVLGNTHSGDSLSVLYGFFCLAVIGFLWGAIGGAATFAPAVLSRERLVAFLPLFGTIFVALIGMEYAYDPINAALKHSRGIADTAFRHEDPLYWYDTDWTSTLAAMIGTLVYAGYRRRWDEACSLVMHMLVGWWISFVLFPVLLNVRMTPPRGDSWAGNLGMVVGMFIYLHRRKIHELTIAGLITGIAGAIGFSLATAIKLVLIKSGADTNYHSIMEQTYGLINGIGIAIAGQALIGARAHDDALSSARLPEAVAVFWVLFAVPFLNIRQNMESWIKSKAMPAEMYFMRSDSWFLFAWLLIGAAVARLIAVHRKRPLAFVPQGWRGKAEVMYLAFLWIFIVANFERALPVFKSQRLVTEFVIFANALVCTVWLVSHRYPEGAPSKSATLPAVRRIVLRGGVAVVACIFCSWASTRLVWGDVWAKGHGGYNVRFGPNANWQPGPSAGKPHP